MQIEDCKFIEFKRILDDRGTIVIFEPNNEFNFEHKRTFYIYGVPDGCERGGHALRDCQQIMIPISGSFRVKAT